MTRRDPAPWREVLRGNVLAVGVVSLLTDLASEMMNPLLPLFLAGLAPAGLAPIVLGTMEGVAEATASLLKLVSGRLSDRLGRRKGLVLIGYGLSAMVRPLMALVSASNHVIGVKFIDRIGKGLRTSPRDALLGDAAPPSRRALAFSFHRAMDHTGAVLGPLVAAGLLYAQLGYSFWRGASATPTVDEMSALRVVFAAALVPGLVAVAVVLFAVRESPLNPTVKPASGARDVAPPDVAPPDVAPADAVPPLPRRFYSFVAVAVLFALGNSSDLFLLLYAHEKFALGMPQVLGLWVALHLAKAAGSLPGGLLADRIGRRPAIFAGWTLYALCYLGFGAASALWHIGLLLVAYGVYYGLTEGALKAMVTDYTVPAQRATAFGVFHGALGLAALPASLVFGVLWARLGPQAAFSLGAGLAAAAALGLFMLGRAARPEMDDAPVAKGIE
ncbi:MAG: MFS transporter [Nannocystis sp.]|nr:MFS transporter [Nannocystis sp.]MBA3547859.1 MFS transporter [Nannocystis sp.]